jgi:DNA-binding CsgD family transcriptional regulator
VSEHGLLRFLDFLVQEENDAVFLLKPRHEDERKQEAGKPAGGLATDEHGSDTSGTAQPGSVGEADIGPAIDPDDLSKMRKIPKLSQRELKVLEGIVRGLQNKMIAREYGIAEATVKVHMKAILRKVQVTNRTQAAVWAMENHVTQLEHSNTTGGGELPAEQPAPSGGSSHEQSGPRPALSGPRRTGSSSLGA